MSTLDPKEEKPSRRPRSMSRELGVSTANRKSGAGPRSAPASGLDGAAHSGRVPDIISKLYSASALYPGEDGDAFEHLLNELAAALGPTDVIEWLLVADLRAAIFDERLFRRTLAMFLSPGEFIHPEPSELAVRAQVLEEAQRIFWKRKELIEEGENNELYKQICEEVSQHFESKRALEVVNAPELSRRRMVENFRRNAAEIETLNRLIDQAQKRRYELLSQLGAVRGLAYTRASAPAQIEDADYSETTID